ncbi:MAG TPA: DUF3810 family protein, partial [Armatimonadota bacterium]|nr:DUF3810 family protein [Armatimonadota bacterium]
PDLFLGGRLGQAKPVCFSTVMGYLGLSGVYSPLTGEANYNRLLPDSGRVFAIAHEKAHQRGIASENEANFVAFLALRSSPDRYLRYCGYLNAAGYALGAIAGSEPDTYPDLAALLRGRPAVDAMRDTAFWRRYRGPVERVSTRVNDLYLRANRVPGGIRSYDAVTDLLIGFWRQEQ